MSSDLAAALPPLVVFQDRRVLLVDGEAALPPVRPGEVADGVVTTRTLPGLGFPEPTAVLVDESWSPPEGTAFRSLRTALLTLPERTGRGLGKSLQLLEWDRDHRFCGRCGGPTEDEPSDRSRRCAVCELSFYPRVAPAVIVLVWRDREVLLARSPSLPAGMFSTLAGFVEPGEDLEETVRREIREEVGVEVTDLAYFGSQPWPFPHSLMVGFHARWAGGEIRIDPEEIEEAAWFPLDELPRIPPRISIARSLIDAHRRRSGLDSRVPVGVT